MKGLKRHTHSERERVIREITPLVQMKFGENLAALAATSSFARNEDHNYSDLELTAFVKEMPKGVRRDGIGKIRDGLLVELVWTTKEFYIQDTLEVTKDWYLAGSDTLLPIIGEELIRELNRYKPDLDEKCLQQARANWHEVHESTAKVLNSIIAGNRHGMPLLVADMLRHMLIVLSFLNRTPFVTFASFVSQARDFKIKPAHFDRLADLIVQGRFQDQKTLEVNVVRVFTELEGIFEGLGVELYDDNFDLDL